MKNICFINGSFRGKEASSLVFLNCINGMLADAEFNKDFIRVRAKVKEGYPDDDLRTISRADAIIMVFPLFTYGIPGALMRLLEDFSRYAEGNDYNKAAGIYIVVNGGFPRPEIMTELIRVMKNFCRRLSLNLRFAICMGGGPVAAMTVKAPLLNMKYRRAFSAIVSDIKNGDKGQKENYFIKPLIPEPILLWYKAQYEKKMKVEAVSK
jgi:hypothetical protein